MALLALARLGADIILLGRNADAIMQLTFPKPDRAARTAITVGIDFTV